MNNKNLFFGLPILWRYLLGHFIKVALFCICAFIAILLTMRLDEIAHFAALGAPLSYIGLFTIYQIPYILPIAIPISCLIASLLLIQRLSSTHELTALRASGFAFRDILAPILLAAALIAVCNFWIVSEVTTQSHLTTNLLKSELRSINPLLLLNNKHLMRLRGYYFNALGNSRVGEFASDVILALPNHHQERINLLIAKRLQSSSAVFVGEHLTLLSSMEAADDPTYDHLFIENIEESVTPVQDFAQLLQKKVWAINNDYLQLGLLLVRIEEQQNALENAKLTQQPAAVIKSLRYQLHHSITDIFRRFSIAIAVFSFTLMGAVFGINISRKKQNRGVYLAILLTVTYLMAFFVAKGLDHNWILAAALYLSPHLLIILGAIFMLRRVTRGIE